jgi:uncharacterized membrane protein YdfJ with MMPL/SSD domain
MMSSLASLVVRRRRAVIMIWAVLLVGAGTIGSSAFSVLSSSFGAGPSTESGRVAERLADTGGEIAIIADGIDVDDPAIAASVTGGLARVAALDGVIAVADPWSTGSGALRASDGRAALADIKARISERLPLAALMVVAATLVLLFLMTGSIIVPIKAVLMNILSLGASFGALVWIFQEGHLAGLLGFDSVGALDLWMPVLILIFAFGLSMDYEVFLLSRIKEVHDETGDSDLAVAVGLQRSGRIITSAAFLIVIVFAGFAAGEVLAIKQLGVGLAIAVLVDATIVRTLLVPATMKLLGERNWWAPAPLRRFHHRFGLHEAPGPTAPHAGEPSVDLGQTTPDTEPAVEGEPVGAGSR